MMTMTMMMMHFVTGVSLTVKLELTSLPQSRVPPTDETQNLMCRPTAFLLIVYAAQAAITAATV